MVLEVDLAESDADSYLGIDIDNGERARFTSSGLGIGTSSPSSSLHVAKANAALGFDAGLWISSHPREYTAGRGGGITFQNVDVYTAGIYGLRETASWEGALAFYTHTDGSGNTFGSTFTEKMRLTNEGRLGIGTTSPSFELDVEGNIGMNGKLYHNGDHNTYIGFDSDEIQLRTGGTDRVIINSSGNVGIGTTSPDRLLTLQGDNSYMWLKDAGGGNVAFIGGDGANDGFIRLYNGSHSAKVEIQSDGDTYFNGGDVGIGTTSPTEKLHVEGSLLLNVATSSGLGEEGIFFRSGFSDSNKYNISILSYAHDGSGNFSDGISINGYDGVSFCTGSNSRQERMRIDSSGQVGIGTTSPSYPLDVKGKVGVGSDGTVYWGNAHDYGKLTWDTGKAIVRGESGKALSLGANATQDTIYINTSQNVGIGTTSPDNVLHVQESALSGRSASNSNTSLTLEHSTDTGIQFFSATQTQLRFGDAGSTGAGAIIYSHSDNILRLSAASAHRFTIGSSEAMRIDSSGNIGIGTSSPASGQKLTVSGDATVTATMTCATISKLSGSFKIDHPLKPKTHSLVHSFVESPQADNTYSGKLRLIKGEAELNLDEYFGMTEGTIVALNRDFRVFTTNESNWDNVKGSVKNNILYIESNNPESMAEVSWLVIGERQDKEIHESELTNDEGKIILEPSK